MGPRNAYLTVVLSAAERALIKAAASAELLKESPWARQKLVKVAEAVLEENGRKKPARKAKR